MKLKVRVRLLPILVIVSMLSFMVRVGDFWVSLKHMGEAQAQEKVDATPPPLPADAKKAGEPPLPAIADAPKSDAAADVTAHADAAAKADDKTGSATPDAKELAAKAEANSNVGSKTSWKDATEEQYACSDTQEQLNQDLVKRREDLDRQAKELATRQALLSAAKQELDQKVTEMTNLRNEIKGMMGTLSDQEKARIQSLVKIYENMKPDDAARIFNTLDMDVLIEVMGQMKEAKSALVLAAMNSDRAKAVTVLLAQQKKLPDMAGAPPSQ
jgi:flagellar motility protein MotE (MotC chaperone)